MDDWVLIAERMPTKADADTFGCIEIFDQLNGTKITGWQNEYELSRPFVTHWKRTTPGPKQRFDLTGTSARLIGYRQDGHVEYDEPERKVYIDMEAIDKLRDEMAANPKNPAIQRIGEYMTDYVRNHQGAVIAVCAEGTTLTGALKALEDYARKQPRSGNCAVVDDETAYREVLRYYGIKEQKAAPTADFDNALDLDALLNI